MKAVALWRRAVERRQQMVVRKSQRKRLKACPVELAVAAVVDGNQNPLDDADLAKVNPDRTSLDLPDEEHREMCSRCGRPAVAANGGAG